MKLLFSTSIIILLSILIITDLGYCQNNNKYRNTTHDITEPFNNDIISNKQIIKLKEDNFVTINGEINDLTASNFAYNIYTIGHKTIYIYINSPGGSVVAGANIIDAIDTLVATGKNIVCIADVAASMGFAILQSCPTRYVKSGSILMQHQSSIKLEDSIEKIRSKLNLIDSLEKRIVSREAKRFKLTFEEYKQKIMNDWWLYGEDAVEQGAADDVVSVICDFDFRDKTYVKLEIVNGMIVPAQYSVCPLIKAPIID